MFDIDISISGVEEVDAMLEGMAGRARNFRPVFWWAREELGSTYAKNVTSRGSYVGGWDPRRPEMPWPLMVKSGRLASSLANLTGPPNHIGAHHATFGTDVEHAQFHQYGTWKMAKRQLVFEPVGFADKLGDVAADYVTLSGVFR